MVGSIMYRRILLASEATVNADGSLAVALALAAAFDARLTLLLVTRLPAIPISIGEVDDAKRAAEVKAAYIVSIARNRASAANVEFHADVVTGTFVYRTLEYLYAHPADLLVIRDQAARYGLFHSRGVTLAHRAKCSVHLVRG